MLKAGLVGFGWWGQLLAKSLAGGSDKIAITQATTRAPERITAQAETLGIATAPDYAAMLAEPEIDAVILATPHSVHLDQIRKAAAAGKHIFAEKPLTLTAEDARAAYKAAQDAGVLLAVGHNRRFHPSMRRLAQLVSSGALGRIVNIESNISAPGLWMYRDGTWRLDREEQPAGGITGLGIHLIDAIIGLAGPVAHVRAETARLLKTTDLDEVTNIQMRLESGAPAYIGTSIATNIYFSLRIFGSDGWAEIRNGDLGALQIAPRGGEVENLAFPGFNMQRAELEAFAEAVEGGPSYPVPEAEVIHGIEVMAASIRSAATGAPVALR
jgi:predicted dehydrogenase